MIGNFNLKIPDIWERDWKQIIENSEGIEQQLLIFEAHGAYLLEKIADYTVTPERLGWLSLWSKAFSAIDSALTALPKKSDYLLKILSRVAHETELHIVTIMEPVLSIHQLKNSRHKVDISAKTELDRWREIQSRICAYVAWGLWNDKRFVLELLNKESLSQAWDPKPVHEIAKDSDKRRIYEEIFGTLNVESKAELLVQRRRQEESLREIQQRLQSWLNDPRLSEWSYKLQDYYRINHRELTFFDLLNENKNTIRQRLKELNLGFAYSAYKEGSMIIHGATLEQFYHLDETHLMPMFVMLANNAESSALFVGSTCNLIFVLLQTLQSQLWAGSESVEM